MRVVVYDEYRRLWIKPQYALCMCLGMYCRSALAFYFSVFVLLCAAMHRTECLLICQLLSVNRLPR